MTRPAKVSSSSQDGVNNGNDGAHSRPMATEARPNPVILEDDNEGSTSKETTGKLVLVIQCRFIATFNIVCLINSKTNFSIKV